MGASPALMRRAQSCALANRFLADNARHQRKGARQLFRLDSGLAGTAGPESGRGHVQILDTAASRFWTQPRPESGHGRIQILDAGESRFWMRPGPDSGHGRLQILDTAVARFWTRLRPDSGRGAVQNLDAAATRFWTLRCPESGRDQPVFTMKPQTPKVSLRCDFKACTIPSPPAPPVES